jgi:hypothetical protein
MQGFKKHLEEKLKASDDMGDWVKDFQDSDAPQFKGKSQKKRQQMAVAAKLAAERNEETVLENEDILKKMDYHERQNSRHIAFANQHHEKGETEMRDKHRAAAKEHIRAANAHAGQSPSAREKSSNANAMSRELNVESFKLSKVELDEVSDKMLDRYRQKAFADQPSGDDGSNKYRKRKFGRDLAFAKQTGRAKVLATKEEVELSESNLSSDDLHRIAKDHDSAAKKHGTAYKETRSSAAARNHEVAYNRHVDAARAHREAAKDKNKHSGEKLEKMSNHAWDASDHVRKHFDESVELDEVSQDLARKTAKARQQQASQLRQKAVDEPDMMKAFAQTKAANKAEKKAGQSYNRLMKKEEVEQIDEQTQYDLVEAYLLENNIDVDTLSVEQLDEIIGKVVGGVFKLGAKAAVGAGRLAKKAIVNKQGNVRGTQAAKNDAMKAKLDKLRKQRATEVQRQKLKKDVERAQAKLSATKSRA